MATLVLYLVFQLLGATNAFEGKKAPSAPQATSSVGGSDWDDTQ